jgi:methionyl-tRNA formyltransferase
MIRTVFFGTPDFAVTCLKALIEAPEVEVCAVVTAPDRPSGRGLVLQPSPVARCAMDHGLPILKPERLRDEQFLAELRSYEADVFTVVAFRMLPEVVWAMPRLGSLNIHGSLLPDLRGAAPIQWSLAYGDSATGLTAFSLNAHIDEGPLLAQHSMAIGPNETFGELYPRMADQGARLAVHVLGELASGTTSSIPQDDDDSVRLAPKLGPDFAQLELLDSAISIHNRIRACDPIPGASLPNPERLGERFKLFQSEYVAAVAVPTPTVVSYRIENEGVTLFDSHGTLRIHEVQWPGKRRMPVADFLRGTRIRGHFTLSGQKID